MLKLLPLALLLGACTLTDRETTMQTVEVYTKADISITRTAFVIWKASRHWCSKISSEPTDWRNDR